MHRAAEASAAVKISRPSRCAARRVQAESWAVLWLRHRFAVGRAGMARF